MHKHYVKKNEIKLFVLRLNWNLWNSVGLMGFRSGTLRVSSQHPRRYRSITLWQRIAANVIARRASARRGNLKYP